MFLACTCTGKVSSAAPSPVLTFGGNGGATGGPGLSIGGLSGAAPKLGLQGEGYIFSMGRE